jgi:membrane-bound serine protease (ClpP class)
VNWAGVLLILLAVGLFVAEVLTPGFGVLFAGGVVSLVIGSLILYKGGPSMRVDPWLIAIVVVVLALLFGVVIQRVWAAHKRQAAAGYEELIGKTAVVREALDLEGTVFLEGELWTANSESGRVEVGEEVKIVKVEGLKLTVTRKQ